MTFPLQAGMNAPLVGFTEAPRKVLPGLRA
jgi:hypothetical protein